MMEMMKMMKLRGFRVAALLAVFIGLSGLCGMGLCVEHDTVIRMMNVGDVRDSEAVTNDAEIDSLGRFAIQEHNKKENTLLEYAKVLKAKEQVVAGKLYYLTLEAIDAGKKKIYEAKIWVKPWMNFKQLEEFKQAHVISPFRSSDLGGQLGGHELGWREVPTHDPEVKDAANYAVKSIVQRSNSLSPYELLEIVLAKAKVVEDHVKYNLLLKVRRGIRDERFVVELTKKLGGKFYVSWMKQDCF